MEDAMRSSVPLAYLLTWTTYGAWLPGDQRGWVRRKQGFQAPDPSVERRAREAMSEPVCELDRVQRHAVEETIRPHGSLRGWRLHAVNCRSNHVHVVVTVPSVAPHKVIAQLKAWCTRELKARSASEGPSPARSEIAGRPNTGGEQIAFTVRRNWWTERGSVRLLFNENNVKAAIRYMVEEQ
jgi:REP element-mobilizing transposase RayT